MYRMTWVAAFFLLGVACTAQRPIEEMSLADVALKAAQKAKADALAPDAFRKAENYYLRAKRDFSEGYFDSARKYSDEARLAAERAEFQALSKQTRLRGGAGNSQESSYPGTDPKVDDWGTPPPAAEPKL